MISTAIQELIAPTYQGTDPVFNAAFSLWRSHLVSNIRNRSSLPFNRYQTGIDADLLRIAREHVSSYSKLTDAPVWITLTHPLYLFLTHPDLITKRNERDAGKYLQNLTALLSTSFSRDKVNIVLFETLHHYAAASSRLLEQGLVDGVVFTEYDSGEVLNRSDLGSNRTFYAGGGYNERCFTSSLENIRKTTRAPISVVKDLVIDSPQDRINGLFTNRIGWPEEMPARRRVIKLEQLQAMIGDLEIMSSTRV